MLLELVNSALGLLSGCEVTDLGARIPTHCLYPSFEPVHVFVLPVGSGFRVHDGGGAVGSALEHGRESGAIRRALGAQAKINFLDVRDDEVLAVDVSSADWLPSAILTVANASAAVAQSVVGTQAQINEDFLRSSIEEMLNDVVPQKYLRKKFEVIGHSGRRYDFDFAVGGGRRGWLLIDAINPHPASISSKYVAFSDTRRSEVAARGRLAVYDRALEGADAALIQQVADLVALPFLRSNVQRELSVE